MKRFALSSISIVLIFLFSISNAFAFTRKEHDAYMVKVLFGNRNLSADDKVHIEALAAASYLTIDQFNEYGANEYQILYKYGIESIPSLNEIKYKSNQHHRRLTHRGWNGSQNNESLPHIYTEDSAKWKLRKTLLLETNKKIFNFKDKNDNINKIFSSLIYYIHIIADQISDSNSVSLNPDIIGVGGRNDKYDIIHQLISDIDIIFKSSKSKNRVMSLKAQLKILDLEFSKLINQTGGIATMKDKEEYRILSTKLMNLLIRHIPDLLKEEEFFSKVFYKTQK